jgi:hypothetical protein
MISPVFNPASSGRLQEAVDFDFTKAAIDPRISVARAGATATRVNSSGVTEIVLADTARLDFDPVTKAPIGLLVEEQKTNLLARSIPNAAVPTGWSVGFSTGTFSHSLVSGFGSLTGFQQVIRHEQSVSGRSPLNYNITLSANTTYTLSIFIDVANSQITSGNQTIVQALGFTGATGKTFIAFNELSISGRASITFSTGADNVGTIRIGIGCANVATGTIIFGGWQLEEDDGTSYIPTEATTVTRNADVATITGADFSDWWQAGKGSGLVKARPSTVSGIRPVLQFDDATADNIIALRGNSANPELYVRTGGVDQAQIDAGTIAANTSYRLAGAWAENSCAASLNSGAPVLDGVATIPTVTQARLGSDGTNYLNGHIEAIEYYDERIPNSALQVVSSTAGYQSIIGSVFRDAIIS